MIKISRQKKFRQKITAMLLAVCMAAGFVPTVFAGSISDTDYTAPAVNAASSSGAVSGGFENVASDGGTMYVGTARIPKADGTLAAVKFVYSSSINLNDKSLKLINTELNACGVTIPNGMIYVSHSDYVSDSSLMTSTSERQAVFACGSVATPTVLTAYPPYESVEESFEHLYPGYIFSIASYGSLKPVFEGRSEVTLSEDGQTASTSIVMSEDYVEKVINGKTVRILMINSELKYYFRAPKLVFEKDENYVASNSDIEYHYPTHNSTTSTNPSMDVETTAPPEVSSPDETESDSTSAPGTGFEDDTTDAEPITTTTEPTTTQTTMSTTASTDTTTESDPLSGWTTTASTGISAKASPIETAATQSTSSFYEDEYTTTAPTTISTTASTTTTSSKAPTLPTQPTQNDDESEFKYTPLQNNTGSNKGVVSTRRLPLNIRSGPGMNYMIVTVLPKGTYVTVLDTSNPNWYMVRTMNKTVGYAYSKYIKFV